MKTTTEVAAAVPTIIIGGNAVWSFAATPRHIADTCACWTAGMAARGRKLLRRKGPIICRDATAFAAMIALSLDMMNHGIDTGGMECFVKEYEVAE